MNLSQRQELQERAREAMTLMSDLVDLENRVTACKKKVRALYHAVDDALDAEDHEFKES
jgi:hypothetical protein